MTLRLRLLLVLVGIVAAGLIVSDVVTYTSLRSFLVARLTQQLRSAPGPVGGALQRCYAQQQQAQLEGVPFTSCSLGGNETSVAPGTYGELRDASGKVLLSACFFNGHKARDQVGLPSPLPVADGAGRARTFSVTHTGCGASSYVGVATTAPGLSGPGFGNFTFGDSFVVVVALPFTEEHATLGHLLWVEGFVSLAVLAGLGSLAWWIVRRGLRPLDEMATTAGAIASGDLSQRVGHAEDHTEVGRLGVALNTMLTEIEGAFAARAASEERLRRFLADASHELRTPLTSIRGYAEIFDRGARDRPEDLATSMRHIRAEANRMSELVDDLLLLARLDHERPLAHELVDLTEVAGAAVDAARVKAPDRRVSLEAPAPVVVTGDANRLRQVVDNLAANALNHTPAGTAVDIAVRAEGPTAVLTVSDEGPGIDPADRHLIFEPFHRADPSRARATGGVGLGLAIVSAIAQAHGGTVGVDAADGGGARFWVRLPLAAAAADGPPLPQAAPPVGPPVSPAPPPPAPGLDHGPSTAPPTVPPTVPPAAAGVPGDHP